MDQKNQNINENKHDIEANNYNDNTNDYDNDYLLKRNKYKIKEKINFFVLGCLWISCLISLMYGYIVSFEQVLHHPYDLWLQVFKILWSSYQ